VKLLKKNVQEISGRCPVMQRHSKLWCKLFAHAYR